MGKRSSVIVPYVLCAVLVMVVVGMAVWPLRGDKHGEHGQVIIQRNCQSSS